MLSAMVTPPPTPAPGPTLTPALRRDIERWFARRGVPQLIEGYRSEPAMDSRAAPLISLFLFVETIRHWGTRPDWPITWNLGGILATLAWLGLGWLVVSRLRHRPATKRPTDFDVRDVLAVSLLPALPAAVIDASAREAVTAILGALTGIGLIYVVIWFGVLEIGRWAVLRLAAQLTQIAELVTRTLPLLLILVVFLLFAAEIWEVAHAMSAVELAFVLVLLLMVATLLVLTTFGGELARLEAGTDAETVRADVAGSPAAPLVLGAAPATFDPPPLTWLQRSNLALLVVIPQLLQAMAVGLVVTAFLGLFALIAIPASVQAAWMGEGGRVLAEFHLLDETRTISVELLIVSTVLGGIVGLYFSGLAIADRTYRVEQFDHAIAEVRQILAVRAVYADALRRSAAPLEAAAIPDPG
jgi:hypothetical protein